MHCSSQRANMISVLQSRPLSVFCHCDELDCSEGPQWTSSDALNSIHKTDFAASYDGGQLPHSFLLLKLAKYSKHGCQAREKIISRMSNGAEIWTK